MWFGCFYFLLYIDEGPFYKVYVTFNFQLKRDIIFVLILLEVIVLVFLVRLLFYLVSLKMSMDMEGVSSYECGFDLLSKSRVIFSYRFFLISILFLIFDVEIALMLPSPYFTGEGIFFFLFFLFILVFGLLFEYFIGALDWL